MENLHQLLDKDYKKIKLKITKTQHLLIKVTLNGIKGNFILDTGASNSCVGFESVDYFNLTTVSSETKAAGAGAVDMDTLVSHKNQINIGLWKQNNISIVVFDLSHVNKALISHKTKAVHGIIGADVLQSGKAIIDYYNHLFYLKKI